MTSALLVTSLLLCADAEAPALIARKTELCVTSGASTILPFTLGLSGGVRVEHAISEKLSVTMAFNARVDRTSTDASFVSVGGLSGPTLSSNTLQLSLVPTLRRWFGERPLSGIFVGLSGPFSYARSLDDSTMSGWSIGIVGDVGYSLQLEGGFVAQFSVGPGYTVTASESGGTTSRQSHLGLFTTFSVGYSF
jgi:hypothetical protein